MEQSELNEILEQHRLWIGGKRGKCANLRNADLRDANIGAANLHGANLEGANLRGANLTGANLTGADLECANLECANLEGAFLCYANLTGANLNGANLTGANLTGADLDSANLECANLEGANFKGAFLTRAYLSDAILPDISWIIPGCLVRLNRIKYSFYLKKENKLVNFAQDSFGFIIQDNREEKTFDMLLGDRIIRGIPDWVKYSGIKQNASESV